MGCQRLVIGYLPKPLAYPDKSTSSLPAIQGVSLWYGMGELLHSRVSAAFVQLHQITGGGIVPVIWCLSINTADCSFSSREFTTCTGPAHALV